MAYEQNAPSCDSLRVYAILLLKISRIEMQPCIKTYFFALGSSSLQKIIILLAFSNCYLQKISVFLALGNCYLQQTVTLLQSGPKMLDHSGLFVTDFPCSPINVNSCYISTDKFYFRQGFGIKIPFHNRQKNFNFRAINIKRMNGALKREAVQLLLALIVALAK